MLFPLHTILRCVRNSNPKHVQLWVSNHGWSCAFMKLGILPKQCRDEIKLITYIIDTNLSLWRGLGNPNDSMPLSKPNSLMTFTRFMMSDREHCEESYSRLNSNHMFTDNFISVGDITHSGGTFLSYTHVCKFSQCRFQNLEQSSSSKDWPFRTCTSSHQEESQPQSCEPQWDEKRCRDTTQLRFFKTIFSDCFFLQENLGVYGLITAPNKSGLIRTTGLLLQLWLIQLVHLAPKRMLMHILGIARHKQTCMNVATQHDFLLTKKKSRPSSVSNHFSCSLRSLVHIWRCKSLEPPKNTA